MRASFLFGLTVLACTSQWVGAQTLEPRAVIPTGGSGAGAGTSLSWSVGQAASATYTGATRVATAGVQQPEGVLLRLNIAALLDGPYDAATNLMHDSLRVRGLLPLTEPFSAMGLTPVGLQDGTQLAPEALLTTGPNAVVDWVLIELRGADDASRVDAARPALLQRDGDVVDVDGVSPVRITALPGNYRIALLHRNHLPVLTQAPVLLGPGENAFDLIAGSTPLHVPDAQLLRDGRSLLWQGDVDGDGTVKYIGAQNDRDPILVAIGGTIPTNTITGYLPTDVNMDGTVKYIGASNDRDPMLITIGGSVPTAVRAQPLP
jgi:hypothetical protein